MPKIPSIKREKNPFSAGRELGVAAGVPAVWAAGLGVGAGDGAAGVGFGAAAARGLVVALRAVVALPVARAAGLAAGLAAPAFAVEALAAGLVAAGLVAALAAGFAVALAGAALAAVALVTAGLEDADLAVEPVFAVVAGLAVFAVDAFALAAGFVVVDFAGLLAICRRPLGVVVADPEPAQPRR